MESVKFLLTNWGLIGFIMLGYSLKPMSEKQLSFFLKKYNRYYAIFVYMNKDEGCAHQCSRPPGGQSLVNLLPT